MSEDDLAAGKKNQVRSPCTWYRGIGSLQSRALTGSGEALVQ